MPEPSAQTRADDEAFWRAQEKRRQQLGQPCCSQSNMSWALIDMPGDFAVVIHGESDCLNCFYHHQGRSAARYYSSRLTDIQITTGDTHRPLKHLLGLLAEHEKPEAVIVLGTCPVEVIGDRFETAVEEMAAKTGIPMIPLHTHGLALMPQQRVQDWLYATLAELPQDPMPAERGVNLLGLPPLVPGSEVARVLNALRIQVQGAYPNHTALADWKRVSHARTCFTVDPGMYRKLVKRLRRYDQAVVEVPMPLGARQTTAFYETIAAAEGQEQGLHAAIAAIREPAEALEHDLAARVRGQRLALCVRMLKTHRADQLARGGLAIHPWLCDLGLEVEILLQGPPEGAVVDKFAQQLEELGLGNVPFATFPGPWKLGEALAAGGFRAAVMSDVARNVVEDVGIGWVSSNAFAPFYEGVAGNVAALGRALGVAP